ncbi:hypothetical protein Agub_g12645 [Astrephomene gubernaculifera]|uniref:Bidirectional sugar transporter SWEET n=1 Tax=Astrephomene gubernaculifera TaxID=47775 RepID=A0AAD3DYJ3_9CHLO|nr:hypothetical protein Agub_g12645 [Astrephomene gubernaculifera]
MGVFTETVVPIFGNILATAMLLSPVPAVLRLRRTGKLGDINPLPYPMTSVNCAGWIAYGFATANPYIFPANVAGFLAGLFFSLTAFPCSNQKLQDRITAILVTASGYFILLGLIACFGLTDKETLRMWGTSAVAILALYYLVPLSTLVAIVRSRNAASIYPPLAATAIANGTMWAVYGLAIRDINLWLPNSFGAILGAVQLLLRFKYGAKPAPAAAVAGVAGAAGGEAAGGGSGVKGTAADGDEELAIGRSGDSDTPRAEGRQGSEIHLLAPRPWESSGGAAGGSSSRATPQQLAPAGAREAAGESTTGPAIGRPS